MYESTNLRAARIVAGLNQCDVADKLGVAQGTLSKWERGVTSPSICVAAKMAEMYGVSLDKLAGLKPLI